MQLGFNKLPGLFLVSIERLEEQQQHQKQRDRGDTITNQRKYMFHGRDIEKALCSSEAAADISSRPADDTTSSRGRPELLTALTYDEPLQAGDLLWFSGSAAAVGELRKVPGLDSHEKEELDKLNEKMSNRRLVQAVVGRGGELVGKTIKEVRFRTRFGAAVIAVHREGKRVHEHPGRVKLQAGDVLLLEAGPTFLANISENDQSFALLVEAEDSTPLQMGLFVPALLT